MYTYGFGREWDALRALIEFGSGKNLIAADQAEMFQNGYMGDDLKPTALARQTHANREIADPLCVGGRVTVGAKHQMGMSDSDPTLADDPACLRW